MRKPRERVPSADPAPTFRSKATIDAYAADCARTLGWEPGWAVAEAVSRLGGTIQYVHLSANMSLSGSLYVRGPRDFLIELPHHTSPRRDQFTIAHEIGHYALHSLFGKVPGVFWREGSGRIEWEANWFAGGFMMPADEFRAAAEALGWNEELLAAHFAVSVPAARVRCEVLRAS